MESRFILRSALVWLVLVVLGCVSYDGGRYRTVATTELRILEDVVPAIDVSACEAHTEAALALRDEDGSSWALFVPLGSGPEIGLQAFRHERQAAVCRGQVGHETAGTMTAPLRERTVTAWALLYRAGLALTGGL